MYLHLLNTEPGADHPALLVCPICKGQLTLSHAAPNEPQWYGDTDEGPGPRDQLRNGALWCVPCRTLYRVIEGVPMLIDPKIITPV